MGMVVALTAVSDENIARLLEDPLLIWKVAFPEDPDLYENARKEARGWFARLFSSEKTPRELVDEGERPSVDLDKAWHAIHYLLTGEAEEVSSPLGFLVAGGAQVGSIEVGYGPARVFTSSETRAIHEAFSALTDDELQARFDPSEMTKKDVYPTMWDRPDERDDHVEYVMAALKALRGFLGDTVRLACGMVIVVI